MYYKDLLRYRQAWLGVGLLWIILSHLPINCVLLSYITSIGYGGVDICFFASGIGCFYSLSSEPNALSFMKRRLKRLVPTYLIFIIVWLVYQYICGNFGFQMAIGNLLAVQDFTGHPNAFNWYISAILLFYILAPYFKGVADQASPMGKIFFLVFLVIFSVPFWRANTYIITITRLPVFYLGMLFADMCKKNKQIRRREIAGMAIAFILGLVFIFYVLFFARQHLWDYGLYWYPFILITPPLCLAISYLSMVLERAKITKRIVAFISLCGDYSFELYLVHVLVFAIIKASIGHATIRHWAWVVGLLCIPVGCFVLRRLTMLFHHIRGKMRHA